MSGVEVIGLLASVTQLVAYGTNITTSIPEIYRRLQNAPERIQQHTEQVRELITIAEAIETHRLLQTYNINQHIHSTLTQAKALHAVLDRVKSEYSGTSVRKYWKVLKGSKEKEILANFDRLEKQKSALMLCMSVVQMDIIDKSRYDHVRRGDEAVMAKPDSEHFDLMEIDQPVSRPASCLGMYIRICLYTVRSVITKKRSAWWTAPRMLNTRIH